MADLALVTSGAKSINVLESTVQQTLIAAADLTAGEAVKIDTNGKFVGADASGAGTADVYGLATKAVKSGMPVTAIRRGVVDGIDVSGLAFGAKVYLSDTGTNTGTLADAAGTVSVVLGKVVPANSQLLGQTPDKVLLLEVAS